MARRRSARELEAERRATEDALARVQASEQRAARGRRELVALLKVSQRRVGELEGALEAVLACPRRAPKPIRASRRRGRGARAEAAWVMCASDWHVEERVRKSQVEGHNEYNPEIAWERAQTYYRRNLLMLNAARAAWGIDTVVWWWGGDFVTGYIHDENMCENWLSPTEGMALAMEMLRAGLRFVLDKYDVKRVVIPTNHGNHGRGQQAKWVTADFRTSYEYLMYRLLEAEFAGEPRVEFLVSESYEQIVPIYNTRVRFHHGNGIKGGGGVGGIFPSMYRRINRANSGILHSELDVFGHHHQLGYPPGAVMNGSLIGFNEYGKFLGFPPEAPAQASFVVDAKRGPAGFYPIFCGG